MFGVKGWVKVYSHTDPREQIVKYKHWLLECGDCADGVREVNVLNGRKQGKGVVAQIENVTDPDMARLLIGTKIYVEKSQRPHLTKGSYYWSDLEGLSVETVSGVYLGKLSWLFETGNNDVMVVEGDKERFIPFIPEQVVVDVNLADSTMVVDWDPEF